MLNKHLRIQCRSDVDSLCLLSLKKKVATAKRKVMVHFCRNKSMWQSYCSQVRSDFSGGKFLACTIPSSGYGGWTQTWNVGACSIRILLWQRIVFKWDRWRWKTKENKNPSVFVWMNLSFKSHLPSTRTEQFKYQVLLYHLKVKEAWLLADSYLHFSTAYWPTIVAGEKERRCESRLNISLAHVMPHPWPYGVNNTPTLTQTKHKKHLENKQLHGIYQHGIKTTKDS